MTNAINFKDDNMEISTSNFQTSSHFIWLNPVFWHVECFGMKSNPTIHDFYLFRWIYKSYTIAMSQSLLQWYVEAIRRLSVK